MRKSITPIIGIVILSLMTIVAVSVAFFWTTGVQSVLTEEAGTSVGAASVSDCSRLSIVSVRGNSITVSNTGCDTVSNMSLVVDGVLTNYGLNESLSPGEATTVSFVEPMRAGEEHCITVTLPSGVKSTECSSAESNTESAGYAPQCETSIDCFDNNPCTNDSCADGACFYTDLEGQTTNCSVISDCGGFVCACMSGVCSDSCGDGTCQSWESYSSCTNDCGFCQEVENDCSETWFTGSVTTTDYDNCSCCSTGDYFYNGSVGADALYCWNGLIEYDVDNTQESWCEDNSSFVWFTGSINGSNSPCCGDDVKLDVFYNSSLYCYEGISTIEGDLDNSVCYWKNENYTWFNDLSKCCGDDGIEDDFYNGSISNTTFFCQDGLFTKQLIDNNETLCDSWGYEWFNGSIEYGGTYSFKNDDFGSNPEGWSTMESGGTVYVMDEYNGHKKIVKIYDSVQSCNSGGRVYFTNTFSSQTNGSIEFWWANEDMEASSGPYGYGGWFSIDGASSGTDVIRLSASNINTFDWYCGGSREDRISLEIGEWYHVRVDFDCSTDVYSVWLNGELLDDDCAFETSVSSIDKFWFHTPGCEKNMIGYVDSVSYSWDEYYEISDNLAPRCCGDDNSTDIFYNGTINSTNNFCHEGIFIKNTIDEDELLCSYYNYTWLSNISSGNNSACCGDDSEIDNFNNETSGFGSVCYQGDYYNASFDQSKINCESNGFTWFNGSIDYPATYSFTSESQGTSGTSIDFIDGWSDYAGVRELEVMDEYLGHHKVIRAEDMTDWNGMRADHNLDAPQSQGTIEWWMLMTDKYISDQRVLTYVIDSGSNLGWRIMMERGNFRDSEGNEPMAYENNKWYHIRVDFDCNAGENGLYDWYVNGELMGKDIYFETNISEVTTLVAVRGHTGTYSEAYFDGFGFSWDSNYTSGNNAVAPCCGDDNSLDNFSNTTNSCINGVLS